MPTEEENVGGCRCSKHMSSIMQIQKASFHLVNLTSLAKRIFFPFLVWFNTVPYLIAGKPTLPLCKLCQHEGLFVEVVI